MSVLVLHGLGNHRPPSHWQFHLAAALAADGVPVAYPSLPEPDAPDPDAWEATLRDALGTLPTAPVVVCHSLACALWLRDPAARPAVEHVLLVAPPAEEVVAGVAAAFVAPLPPPGDVRGEVWSSDADPYNPPEAAITHARPLVVPYTEIPGGGHLTPDDGFGRWPAIETRVRDLLWTPERA